MTTDSARRRVLIVDDEPEARTVLVNLCEREGFDVSVATTVAEAVESFASSFPDAVIVDVVLPDGDGYSVVRELRRRCAEVVVPVVFVSVLNGTEARVEALRAGSDAYFEKPFEWEAVVRKLRSLLARSTSVAGRILIVEDDPDQAQFLGAVLRQAGYETSVCDDPRRFAEAVEEAAPELVLIDVHLPFCSGYELSRLLRQNEGSAPIPVIFMTAEQSLEAELESIASGGDDHLRKPIDPRLLLSSLAARIERSRQFQTLVERDALTGLRTRAAFDSHAAALLAKKQRARRRDAVMIMIDVDLFKNVNDTHGHAAGDQVLAQLARHLERGLRDCDVIGRYGGEELVALLDESSEPDAQIAFERLLVQFGAMTFGEDPSFHVTFSAGVAAIDFTSSVAEWYSRADRALYAAKAAGRQRVVAAASLETAVLDERIIDSLRVLGSRGNVDLLGEVAEIFTRVGPQRVDAIRAAVLCRDYPSITTTAHALRSASANIGAIHLSDLCGAVERESRSGSVSAVEVLLPRLEHEFLRATDALSKVRSGTREE